MSTEQQRKMLECAAKACGAVIDKSFNPSFFNGSVIPYGQLVVINKHGGHSLWNPLTNPGDTAEMSITLMLWVSHDPGCVSVCNGNYAVTAKLKDHDNSRKKAWMFAATMIAAKIGGYTDGTL